MPSGVISIQHGQALPAVWTLNFYVPASLAAGSTVNGSVQPYAGSTVYGPPSPPSGAPYGSGFGYSIPPNEVDGLLYLYVNAAPVAAGQVNFTINNQSQQYSIDLTSSQRLQGSLGYMFTPPLILDPTFQIFPTLTIYSANGSSAVTQTAFLQVARKGT